MPGESALQAVGGTTRQRNWTRRGFRDHILGFFQKHGMTNVAYFKRMDAPLSQTTLIYLLSHESREAAARSWSAFQNDPDWKKVSSAGGGPLASKVESVFLQPTDYSPMK